MKNGLQMNLDSFFKTNNQRKQIFYIDWSQSNPRATWLLKKPKDTSFSCTVKWYHIGDIIICSKDKESIKDDSNTLVNINLEKINSKLFD